MTRRFKTIFISWLEKYSQIRMKCKNCSALSTHSIECSIKSTSWTLTKKDQQSLRSKNHTLSSQWCPKLSTLTSFDMHFQRFHSWSVESRIVSTLLSLCSFKRNQLFIIWDKKVPKSSILNKYWSHQNTINKARTSIVLHPLAHISYVSQRKVSIS